MTAKTWEEAHTYAQAQANKYGCSYGIEKLTPLPRDGLFHVFMLPKPENRYGFELRCEVVDPSPLRAP